MAAPSILKAVPAIQKLAGQGAEYVRQGVNYVKNAATGSGQLRNAGERLLASMGPGAIARKAVPALGLGYTAGSLANKLIPTIMDAGGFINTKEVYGNKTPHLSEILADWYRTANTGAYGAEQAPERTYGDRWADAYRAIWAAKKLTPEQRAKALADLAKTRENWKASGINLSDSVTEGYDSSGQNFEVKSTPDAAISKERLAKALPDPLTFSPETAEDMRKLREDYDAGQRKQRGETEIAKSNYRSRKPSDNSSEESLAERVLGREQLNRLRLKRDKKTSTAPAPDAAISKERLAKALPDPLTFSPETAEDMRKLLEEYDAAQRGESVAERVLGREKLDRLRLKNGKVR
jgi:Spy/CpxP family protein refolding chaperone